jgi:hypothetical protein
VKASTALALSLSAFASFAACAKQPEPSTALERSQATRPTPSAPLSTPTDHAVILVVDGVRWREVFYGVDPVAAEALGLPEADGPTLMPHLHALAKEGVTFGNHLLGDRFYASGPNYVSLPGYTEILTGRPADCQENDCEPHLPFTIAGEATIASVSRDPTSPWSVVLSSWPNIAQIAPNEAAITSTGRKAGTMRERLAIDPELALTLQLGEGPSPFPFHPDYRSDVWTGQLAIQVLKRVAPPVLFVSLVDTDEHGHALEYGAYLDALACADTLLGGFMDTARGLGPQHRVTFFVTTDHGRANNFKDHGRNHPESAETWLIVGGGRVGRGARRWLAPSRHLRDIAPTIRVLLGLPNRGGSPLPEVIDALRPK